ncbi:MAG: divergent polysaccharide deacetylase family protein [Pseudomonadota bacterium]
MGRGFLSGIFWGAIVSIVALFVSHQAVDRQSLSFPKPEAAEVDVPGGSEFNQARPETDPVVPSTDSRPEGDTVAVVPMPEEDVTEPPVMDTTALEVPVPETTQDAPETLGEAPEDVAEVTEPEVPSADTTVSTEAAAAELEQPEAPATAPERASVEEEVLEAAPIGEEEQRAPLIVIHDNDDVAESTEIAALPDTDETPAQPTPEVAPQVTGQVDAPDVPSAPEITEAPTLPWLDRLREAQLDEAPDAPELPAVSAEPSLPPVGAEAPDTPTIGDSGAIVQEDAVASAVEEALDALETGTSADDGENLLQPVETLTERDDDAADTGSLPVVRRLGDASSDDTDASEAEVPEDVTAETEVEIDPDAPALTKYAAEFEAPAGVPLLSIVLVQQGADALSAQVLDALPETVGFAVDASLPDAAGIARTYRAAGHEVVMIPALPNGAAPQDIEQALGANFELVPEAVAVMDVSGSSFQSDRAAVDQVVDVVADTGHGLITFPRGLNTAHQAAQRAGVPTGLIFRNMDAASEDQEQIRRTLDRAAFRARQDDAVILVGTTGSTMLSALTDWVLGNRAASVAIAPVSTALSGGFQSN